MNQLGHSLNLCSTMREAIHSFFKLQKEKLSNSTMANTKNTLTRRQRTKQRQDASKDREAEVTAARQAKQVAAAQKKMEKKKAEEKEKAEAEEKKRALAATT